MERNYGLEIDALREELAELKKQMKTQKPVVTKRSLKTNGKVSGDEGLEENAAIKELKEFAAQTNNETGVVSYHGFFRNENRTREANWGTEHCDVQKLMELPAEKISAVLSSLGNQQRWEILCALLKKPMTVAQLVEEFDMKTSGKAYHHLNNLLAADLLEEVKHAEKGWYTVKGHRVQGIIMILAGVADLVDSYYSNGEWKV